MANFRERLPDINYSGVLRRDGNYVMLSHMDAAGYLMYRNVANVRAEKISRFKYRFIFYDPDHRAEKLAMEFVNSESQGHADAIKRLKNSLNQFCGRDEEWGGFKGESQDHSNGNGTGNGNSRKDPDTYPPTEHKRTRQNSDRPLPVIGRGPGSGRCVQPKRRV
jgi:hypothetical protein